MAKSYRPRRARRRLVSIRIPRAAYDLLVIEAAMRWYGTMPLKQRRRAAERAILNFLANDFRGLVAELDEDARKLNTSVDELMRDWVGGPASTWNEIFTFITKHDPCNRDSREEHRLMY